MAVAGESAVRGGELTGLRAGIRTIAACATATVLMAMLQLRFVLDVTPSAATLVTPALVGALFGALVASLRAARARERSMAVQLAAAHEARFEAMRRLAGGVGHDLNNLFAVAMSCSACVREIAAQRRDGPCRGCAAALDDVDVSLDRARNIARQLVVLSRPASTAPELVDLGDVIRGVAPMLRRVLGSAIRLEVVAPDAAHVRIDRTELEQIVLNLAVNARDAMPHGGTLSIAVHRDDATARLAVRDTGIGMDEGTRARMFEPFFTTKPAGRGTGLSLMVVAQVVERGRGRIAVRSSPGGGTEVTASFPLVEWISCARRAST